jgi:hypothetical protein
MRVYIKSVYILSPPHYLQWRDGDSEDVGAAGGVGVHKGVDFFSLGQEP